MAEKKSYKDTLNLPKTDFDMRAGLLEKEPAIQKKWAEEDLYGQIRAAREGEPRFILHDGPPYANGNIHIGHTLNKVLKDMVVRCKTMAGFDSPYIPGWDCHGLPIEAKVMENLGDRAREMEATDIRKKCFFYAKKFVDLQSEQFQRLGVMGEFDDPYITMAPQYEADTLEVFARLVERGLVFRQLKPVHWSIENQTALAEAELEYQDREDDSIYVAFPLAGGDANCIPHRQGDTLFALIWTTTPWTLPANRAAAVHPQMEYTALHADSPVGPATVLVATERLEAVRAVGEEWLANAEAAGTVQGQQLVDAGLIYEHPLTAGMTCPIVAAEYVTAEDGTGVVHTAPGHGTDDYFTGKRCELEIFCPVGPDGTFDETAPDFLQGLSVWDANPKVIEFLREKKLLVAAQRITHSYPHDWRSKGPTIFRATEQWFLGVDRDMQATGKTLRQMALDLVDTLPDEPGSPEIGEVEFVPAWGRNRMRGMLENRPDWCISRQRAWGLPIPAFYNDSGLPLLTPDSIRAVADVFEKHELGSNAWFTMSPAELLEGYDPAEDDQIAAPEYFQPDQLTKGNDIFDVWFESGSSWHAVAERRGLVSEIPVDMYLEGSDQHRGWFQLSLLPALGATATPPFKTVLTHGFINDAEGRKMSKSLGNTIDVLEQLSKRGADILRVWVASQDYQDDDRCSEELIAQCEDTYRKFRNTLRYCMGSLADHEPGDGAQPAAHSIDLWMRMRLHKLIRDVRDAYDRYEFHRAMRLLYEFCAVEASNIYFSAVKDRLYCEAPDSDRRRATQGVLHEMLDALVRLLAPIIPHTAEEAWQHMPGKGDNAPASVHLALLPGYDQEALELAEDITPGTADFFANEDTSNVHVGPAWIWEQLLGYRSEALNRLEALRKNGLKNPLDAEMVFHVPADKPGLAQLLDEYRQEMEDMLGVGFLRIEQDGQAGSELAYEARDTREQYPRCERSWKRRPDVGSDPDHPDVSARDAAVLKQIGHPSD